ncbi:hypothetical protein H8K52_04875 [Undibacterium seohonense]|uniref:Uncharacterized protein n=1 Tax=Undibacterium seohonense TaxID=1344950 RepID=A0ABR6X221_9BURK|nr:hypothetical protein [Undibacterium seohonense]MBC3806678.1 hypothetical protein [Undibacterium seohonense]
MDTLVCCFGNRIQYVSSETIKSKQLQACNQLAQASCRPHQFQTMPMTMPTSAQ